MPKDNKLDLHSLKEVYDITYKAFFSLRKLSYARKKQLIDKQFIERIMLAVTQVNDCKACAYGHSKIALEKAMSEEEIRGILSGDFSTVPNKELPAVMFSQHYADYRGEPSEKAYNQLVDHYGIDLAEGIVATIRMIMFGNVYGVAWGSLFSRFKGNPDKRSSLIYELSMVIATLTFIPTALIHSLILNLLKQDIISFKE
ncbi:MAG TPA: carboxymuconolactone decarboxylase family protein [Erysipelotrichaceae bacterium]|nr:carboxymuconolactone decarboxylase family protein [Erysipelotrichaceae bacterium]